MDMNYFTLKRLKVSKNESFTIHFELFDEQFSKSIMVKEYNSNELALRNGLDVISIDMFDCFRLVIHAVVENNVYITLLEKDSEKSYMTIDRIILNRVTPRNGKDLVYKLERKGFYLIYIKEFSKIKRGVMYSYHGTNS